jgi:hypothetical protein
MPVFAAAGSRNRLRADKDNAQNGWNFEDSGFLQLLNPRDAVLLQAQFNWGLFLTRECGCQY